MNDPNCICNGNWRTIVIESELLLDKKFINEEGEIFTFCGVMNGIDDYYYCMSQNNNMKLLSCIGTLEQHGYKLLK